MLSNLPSNIKNITCTFQTLPIDLETQIENTDKQPVALLFSLGAKHLTQLPKLMDVVKKFTHITTVICDPISGNVADPTQDGILADAQYELRQVLRVAGDHKLPVELMVGPDAPLDEKQIDQVRQTYDDFAPIYKCQPTC